MTHAQEHGSGRHAGHDRLEGRALTRMAVTATAHCLTGCAVGEILGMVLATWWGWGDIASIVLAIVLAFFFGYSLTMFPLLVLRLSSFPRSAVSSRHLFRRGRISVSGQTGPRRSMSGPRDVKR